MKYLKLFAILISMVASSASSQESQLEKNRVVVMGMIHGNHRTESSYSVKKVKELIRSVDPDIVLTEIPPDRLADAAKQFSSSGKISESRVARFPEYVDALFPLTNEMSFEIVPCAAWTKPMSDSRRERMAELKKTHSAQYAEMEAAQTLANQKIARLGLIHDPAVIHTDKYDEIIRRGMQPYDVHFNELIGQGGWTNINKAHYALIENALDEISMQNKTVLITFGSWHKYYIKEQLQKRNDIELISMQQFLNPENVADMKAWPRFRLDPNHSGSVGKTEIRKPEIAWSYDTGDIIESSPAVVEDTVYIGGHSKTLQAIDKDTGKQKWRFETAGWIRASPSVTNSTVYFGSDDNKFYALDAKTGIKKWDFELGEGGEQSSPVVEKEMVYFGAFDHFVYALNAKSGQKAWQFDAEASMLSSPALNSRAIFIATYAGKLFAIDKLTGTRIWQFQQNDKPIFASPVVNNGKIFVTSYDKHIYCLEADSGKVVWKYETGDEIFSSPAIVGSTLYVGSNDHHLYALNADSGKLKWKTDLNGAVFASPCVTEHSIYVGSSDGYLYCLEREFGNLRWRFLVREGAKVWSSAAAVNGKIYFGSHAGQLVALKNEEE